MQQGDTLEYERRQSRLKVDGYGVQITTRFDPQRADPYYGDYFLIFPHDVVEDHVEGKFQSFDEVFVATLAAARGRLATELAHADDGV